VTEIDQRPLEVALAQASYVLAVDGDGFNVHRLASGDIAFWLPETDREIAWLFVRAIERGLSEDEATDFARGAS
jgi:hypothetical protein